MCLIVQINRENHPNITEHPAFVVVNVTIFLQIFAVLLECVNYARKRNFPLPRMEDIIDTLGESNAQIFSSFDMFSGYWQINLDPRTKH